MDFPRRPVRALLAVAVVAVVLAVTSLVLRADRTERSSERGRAGPAVPLRPSSGTPGRATWTAWPMALHDAQHTGASDVVGPQTGVVRWRRDLGADVTPGPVIAADGTVYAATNAGVLHALDPDTGATVWTVDGGSSYGLDLSTSPAVLPSGLVLWPGPGNDLVAVSPAGDVRWRLPFDGQPTSPAVAADGEVVVGDTAGSVVALTPTDDGPHVRWRWSAQESSYGSVVVSPDGRTVYQSVLSGVVAVRDGELVWRAEPADDILEVSAAVAPDGTVVVGTNDDYEYGLRPTDGSTAWRYRKDVYSYSSPGVTLDGLAYFGDHRNRVVAVDATTGRLRYRFEGDRTDSGPGGIGIWTSVLVDAHHDVYVGTRQGLVYGADADGRLLWSQQAAATVDSYPALGADGTLYIGTTDGQLLAIGDGVAAYASITTGMIMGRRRWVLLTQRPTTRRTVCWSW